MLVISLGCDSLLHAAPDRIHDGVNGLHSVFVVVVEGASELAHHARDVSVRGVIYTHLSNSIDEVHNNAPGLLSLGFRWFLDPHS